MDKRKFLETYVRVLNQKIQEIEKSLASVAKQAQDAPGFNISGSDTTKYQLSNVALGIERRLIELRKKIMLVQSLKLDPHTEVIMGAMFALKDIQTQEITYYFLIPEQGGDGILFRGEEIICISPEAPIAQAALHQQVGSNFVFRGKKFEITEIF